MFWILLFLQWTTINPPAPGPSWSSVQSSIDPEWVVTLRQESRPARFELVQPALPSHSTAGLVESSTGSFGGAPLIYLPAGRAMGGSSASAEPSAAGYGSTRSLIDRFPAESAGFDAFTPNLAWRSGAVRQVNELAEAIDPPSIVPPSGGLGSGSGVGGGLGGAAPVPEPTTVALLACPVTILLRRRKR